MLCNGVLFVAPYGRAGDAKMKDGGEITLEMALEHIAALEREIKALRRELARRAESLPQLLSSFYHPNQIPTFSGVHEKPVDLVLSVRDTYDFLRPCLDSLFTNTDIPFHLFLNDNASSDPRTPALLREVRDRHPDRVSLFLQEKDLGFTDAAQMLLERTTNDVILVNADTELPPRWASRLLWPIRHSGENVASCTPFCNAGSYEAFPECNQDSALFEGLPLGVLDGIFQSVKPTANFRPPVGVGFCMAMSRKAISTIGLLDVETYRPGYGEETDWCARAAMAGFLNVFVPNLFIYHKHGATMTRASSTERERLRTEHYGILKSRYPNVEHELHAFLDNPERQAMVGLLLLLSSAKASGGVKVVITAPERFEGARIIGYNDEYKSRPIIYVGQRNDTGEYLIRFSYKGYEGRFISPNLNWVIKLLYRMQVTAIVLDALPPHTDTEKVIRALDRLAQHNAAMMTNNCRKEG